MNKLYIICSLLLSIISVQGQYVTIPDTVFVNWLNNNGFAACLNGNQLDTTCQAVLNADTLSCDSVSIQDLTGIQFFKNLKVLNCYNDSLIFIPLFPASLTTINCQDNMLLAIPVLPQTLKVLNCSRNQLNSLPDLPLALEHLVCDSNPIASLPVLPPQMNYLECCNDLFLTHLPALAPSLKTLNCNYNNLDNLPALPDSLVSLNCISNQLTTLPALPRTLLIINCKINHLITLPALPFNLMALWCANNNLTSLPAIPFSLVVLSCGNNNISQLPSIPDSLTTLECSFNALTSLPQLPDSLFDLYFSHNPIACLQPLKRIRNLEFNGTNITCLPNYGNVTSSIPPLDSFPLCTIENANACSIYSSINEPTIGNINLKLYPNPATNKLYIDYPLQNATLKISDMTGKEWPALPIGNEIDISALPLGIYCLDIKTTEDSIVRRFVKE